MTRHWRLCPTRPLSWGWIVAYGKLGQCRQFFLVANLGEHLEMDNANPTLSRTPTKLVVLVDFGRLWVVGLDVQPKSVGPGFGSIVP